MKLQARHLVSAKDYVAAYSEKIEYVSTACGRRLDARRASITSDTRDVTCISCGTQMEKGEMIFHD